MNSSTWKLIDLAVEALQAEELCILCSVVRLDGSGYGRVGARLLLTESGDREGYISGGCLEKDLCRRALHEAHTHPKLITFDTRRNAIIPSRYNTGCEGLVYVLCQPLSLESCFYRTALAVRNQRRIARVLTVYRSEWANVSAGDTIAQFDDGDLLSSTRMSETTTVRSLEQLLNRQPGLFTATANDAAGRAIELVVDALQPRRRLVIFGAGDDVKPVVHLATGLDWEVCVVGQQPHLAERSRFPGAKVYLQDYAELADTLVDDEFTHVISMSHDYSCDLRLLPILVRKRLRSVGLLGSRRRLAKLLTELYYRGERLSEEQIERIRSPLGLDIGAESPEDIALSIVSELVAIERGATGNPLSANAVSSRAPLPHYTFSCLDVRSNGTAHPFLERIDEAIHSVERH